MTTTFIEGRMVKRQPAMAIGESDVITFYFNDAFDEGSAYGLASATVSVEVVGGTDGTPSTIKSGICQVSGQLAMQMIVPTTATVEYLLTCSAVTNEPTPRTLLAVTVLPVIRLGRTL